MQRDFNYELVAAEWLRHIRGKRSQVAFSRRLGYRSNVSYLWESQRNAPTAAKALWAASRTGVDVRARVKAFFRTPPEWLEQVDPTTPDGIRRLLCDLRASTPIAEIAQRMHRNRYAVSRWLKGTAEPRLPEFFQLIEVASLRLLDFIAQFADPLELPSVATVWVQLEAARQLAQKQPWAQAVLLALQLKAYRALPSHVPGWVAGRIGISPEVEHECLSLLERAGRLRRDACGRFSVVRMHTVDTRRDQAATQRLRSWAGRLGLDRLDADQPQGVFSYNIFSVSHADYERLQQLQREHFRRVRAIVSASDPADRVVVTNLQLFALDADPE